MKLVVYVLLGGGSQIRVIVAVAHHRMAGLHTGTREVGVALLVVTGVKERGLDIVPGKHIKELLGVLTRAIVKGERDDLVVARRLDVMERHDTVLDLLDRVTRGGLARDLALELLNLTGLGPLGDVANGTIGALHLQLGRDLLVGDVGVLADVLAVRDLKVLVASNAELGCRIAVKLLSVDLERVGGATALLQDVAAHAHEVARLGREPLGLDDVLDGRVDGKATARAVDLHLHRTVRKCKDGDEGHDDGDAHNSEEGAGGVAPGARTAMGRVPLHVKVAHLHAADVSLGVRVLARVLHITHLSVAGAVWGGLTARVARCIAPLGRGRSLVRVRPALVR